LKIFDTKHFDDPTCQKFTEFHVILLERGGATSNSKSMTNIPRFGM